MTDPALHDMIACQKRLIEALDSQSYDAINFAASELANAVAKAQRIETWPGAAVTLEMLELGLKQCTAATLRANYLSAWNRQKAERLDTARGKRKSLTYSST
jgi:hypothetical protein